MRRTMSRVLSRGGGFPILVLILALGLLSMADQPAAALDCSRQEPSIRPELYEVTAKAEYSLREQPFVGCAPDGAIFGGQRARVVAESGEWRFLQVLDTGKWGWVHESAFETRAAGSRGCTNQEMAIVAHPDDDIIFMNPTLDNQVRSGTCVVTVFVTAGDAGLDRSYWSTRESGAELAHATMKGLTPADFQTSVIQVNGRSITVMERPGNPGSGMVFLRLPDGGQGNGVLPAPGYERNGFQSIQKLWSGEINSIDTVDGVSSYGREGLINTLDELIGLYRPSVLHIQDHSNDGSRSDHSDHVHAARNALAASARASVTPAIADYLGYGTLALDPNVFGAERERKYRIFEGYAAFDALVNEGGNTANPTASIYTHTWLPREYRVGETSAPVRVLSQGYLIGVGENCLQVNGSSVQMSDCFNAGSQRWELLSTGQIRNDLGRCLSTTRRDAAGKFPLLMDVCRDVAEQEWLLMDDGRLIGRIDVGDEENPNHVARCVDVINGRTENGAELQMFDCVDVPAQDWRIRASPPPGSPTVVNSGYIVGVGGNCLDVVNGSSANGTNVQMYDCVDVPAQRWQVMSNGEIRGAGGSCLDVVNGSSASGTNVQMYDCAGVAAQQWQVLPNGEIRGVGGNCLDVVNGGSANGTNVQMFACAGVAAQQWTITSSPPFVPVVLQSGYLVGVGDNCLDVVNGGTANQTPVQMFDCADVPAQQWQLWSNGELRGVGGNCLDVVNGGTANQTPVQMYDCVGVAAQTWTLNSSGQLVGVGGNCLDVVNGGTANQTRVQMYDCVDVAAQKWRFTNNPPRVLRSGQLIGIGGNCLDVVNGGTANQTRVQMYDCAGVAAQQWELWSTGELRGVGGNCLDVVNGGTANQTRVQMYDCVGVAAQQWTLTAASQLVGIGGNCLDVVNGGTANQTRVQMYDCVGVAAQQWRFG